MHFVAINDQQIIFLINPKNVDKAMGFAIVLRIVKAPLWQKVWQLLVQRITGNASQKGGLVYRCFVVSQEMYCSKTNNQTMFLMLNMLKWLKNGTYVSQPILIPLRYPTHDQQNIISHSSDSSLDFFEFRAHANQRNGQNCIGTQKRNQTIVLAL